MFVMYPSKYNVTVINLKYLKTPMEVTHFVLQHQYL